MKCKYFIACLIINVSMYLCDLCVYIIASLVYLIKGQIITLFKYFVVSMFTGGTKQTFLSTNFRQLYFYLRHLLSMDIAWMHFHCNSGFS